MEKQIVQCPLEILLFQLDSLHQWQNGNAQYRRLVPGSNPGRACRPSRSEFSVVFSETRVNTG